MAVRMHEILRRFSSIEKELNASRNRRKMKPEPSLAAVRVRAPRKPAERRLGIAPDVTKTLPVAGPP